MGHAVLLCRVWLFPFAFKMRLARDFSSLARRMEGAYPQWSVTGEQRSQRRKRPANEDHLEGDLELVRLFPHLCQDALHDVAGFFTCAGGPIIGDDAML